VLEVGEEGSVGMGGGEVMREGCGVWEGGMGKGVDAEGGGRGWSRIRIGAGE